MRYKVGDRLKIRSDLKVGYVVELRCGYKRIVAQTKSSFITTDGCKEWCPVYAYHDDLRHLVRELDIVKVYGLSSDPITCSTPTIKNRELIWERKAEFEPIELTFEEIAKKFNVPVESLRIKE
jgi:hypothetical protein